MHVRLCSSHNDTIIMPRGHRRQRRRRYRGELGGDMPPIEQSVTEIREAGTQLRAMTSPVQTAEEQPNVSEWN